MLGRGDGARANPEGKTHSARFGGKVAPQAGGASGSPAGDQSGGRKRQPLSGFLLKPSGRGVGGSGGRGNLPKRSGRHNTLKLKLRVRVRCSATRGAHPECFYSALLLVSAVAALPTTYVKRTSVG